MKKNMMKITFIAAFAMIVGCSVYNPRQLEMMSDLIAANVEALAGVDDNWYCVGDYGICYIDSEGLILGHFHTIE